jgi:hypothetical protein
MVKVQDIESGIDKENRDVGDESVEGQNIENQVLEGICLNILFYLFYLFYFKDILKNSFISKFFLQLYFYT